MSIVEIRRWVQVCRLGRVIEEDGWCIIALGEAKVMYRPDTGMLMLTIPCKEQCPLGEMRLMKQLSFGSFIAKEFFKRHKRAAIFWKETRNCVFKKRKEILIDESPR